jgi:CBS domain-containing protein
MSYIRIVDFMKKEPIITDPDITISDAAKIMSRNSIGSLILVQDEKPYGIVTERDLVRRVIAAGKDPNNVKVSEVCSKPVLTMAEDDMLEDAIEMMRAYKVRRVVIVNREGKVSGILTTDDLGYNIKRMSEELAYELIALSHRACASV